MAPRKRRIAAAPETGHHAATVKHPSPIHPGTLAAACLLLALQPRAGAQDLGPDPKAPQDPAPAAAPASAPKPIGFIADAKDPEIDPQTQQPVTGGKMSLDYNYGADSRLILVVHGVEMNGAANSNPGKLVGGDLAVKGNQIQIFPHEIYGTEDAAALPKIYSLRYIIPKLAPGVYRLLHDDSNTGGTDRVIDISLDLKKPVKKTIVVEGKVAPPPAAAAAPAPAAAEPAAPVIKDE